MKRNPNVPTGEGNWIIKEMIKKYLQYCRDYDKRKKRKKKEKKVPTLTSIADMLISPCRSFC